MQATTVIAPEPTHLREMRGRGRWRGGAAMLGPAFVTAVVAFGILALQTRGHRSFELAIAALLGIVCLGFIVDLLNVNVDRGAVVHGLVPSLSGSGSLVLAVGILGATVMPHVVYLHSALTQQRIQAADESERRAILRFARLDVVL